jgi:hypothetical protein
MVLWKTEKNPLKSILHNYILHEMENDVMENGKESPQSPSYIVWKMVLWKMEKNPLKVHLTSPHLTSDGKGFNGKWPPAHQVHLT